MAVNFLVDLCRGSCCSCVTCYLPPEIAAGVQWIAMLLPTTTTFLLLLLLALGDARTLGAEGEVEEVLGAWGALVPGVVKCYMALAGCDLCTYFLATYEVLVAAPACTGSCTMAVLGKCANLLSSSLQNSLG